jgi:tousled-like kinase
MRTIPEKDARVIFMQIISGLRYLSRPSAYYDGDSETPNKKILSIIHFDLKPANILFDEMGDVKITGQSSCSFAGLRST